LLSCGTHADIDKRTPVLEKKLPRSEQTSTAEVSERSYWWRVSTNWIVISIFQNYSPKSNLESQF